MTSGQPLASTVSPARVRLARVQAGLSQSELAEKIGCSLRAIQTWEQDDDGGVKRPRGVHLRRLAEVTGRETSFFFDEEQAA